jgi:hypothetical protein
LYLEKEILSLIFFLHEPLKVLGIHNFVHNFHISVFNVEVQGRKIHDNCVHHHTYNMHYTHVTHIVHMQHALHAYNVPYTHTTHIIHI